MSYIDWVIICAYSSGLILLGWWLGLRQKSSEDYYLAGRKLHWLLIGVSWMATQYVLLILYAAGLVLFLVVFPRLFL